MLRGRGFGVERVVTVSRTVDLAIGLKKALWSHSPHCAPACCVWGQVRWVGQTMWHPSIELSHHYLRVHPHHHIRVHPHHHISIMLS